MGTGHGYLRKVEVLGFVDDRNSLNWMNDAGCKVLNLLCKGSENHCLNQLKKSPVVHIADIKKVLANAHEMDIDVNIYLEDWSNGMRNSMDYVFYMIDKLKDESVNRFMLPDTLGVLNPTETG
jgi:D-citramalate synthase